MQSDSNAVRQVRWLTRWEEASVQEIPSGAAEQLQQRDFALGPSVENFRFPFGKSTYHITLHECTGIFADTPPEVKPFLVIISPLDDLSSNEAFHRAAVSGIARALDLEQKTYRPTVITPTGGTQISPDTEEFVTRIKTIYKGRSSVRDLLLEWADPSKQEGYPDAKLFTGLHVDDFAYAIASIGEAMVKLLITSNQTKTLGCCLGLKKTEWLVSEVESLGSILRVGGNIELNTKSFDKILKWIGIPKDQDLLRSFLGLMIYYARGWGLHYKRLVSTLREIAYCPAKDYPTRVLQDRYLSALADVRRFLSLGTLRPLDLQAILSGARIMIIFIDACLTGCGYAVCSVDRNDKEKWASPSVCIEDMVSCIAGTIQIHEVASTPFPKTTRCPASWAAEVLGTCYYKRSGDRSYKYLPRMIANDHLNLMDPSFDFHPATQEALLRRLFEVKMWFRMPGITPFPIPGDINFLADYLSRAHTSETMDQWSLTVAQHCKLLLSELWKQTYDYEIPIEQVEEFAKENGIKFHNPSGKGTETSPIPSISSLIPEACGESPQENEGGGELTKQVHSFGENDISTLLREASDHIPTVCDVTPGLLEGLDGDDPEEDYDNSTFTAAPPGLSGDTQETCELWYHTDKKGSDWSSLRMLISTDETPPPPAEESSEDIFYDTPDFGLLDQRKLARRRDSQPMQYFQPSGATSRSMCSFNMEDKDITSKLKEKFRLTRDRSIIHFSEGRSLAREIVYYSPRIPSESIASSEFTHHFLCLRFPAKLGPYLNDEMEGLISSLAPSEHPVLRWLMRNRIPQVASWPDLVISGEPLLPVGTGYDVVPGIFSTAGEDPIATETPNDRECLDGHDEGYHPDEPLPQNGRIPPRDIGVSKVFFLEQVRDLLAGKILGKKRHGLIKLDIVDCRDLHEKSDCAAFEILYPMLIRAGYVLSKEILEKGIRACRQCEGNLSKQRRVNCSFAPPNPLVWEIDISFVEPGISLVRQRGPVGSWDDLYKYNYTSPTAIGIRIIATQLGPISCEIASEITAKHQVLQCINKWGTPTEVNASDSEALGDALVALSQLGINCPPLPRKCPNAQPYVCVRQLVFRIDYYKTPCDWVFRDRVRYAEKKVHDRAQHGIPMRFLLPGTSAVFFSELCQKAVVTEDLISTLCCGRIQAELRRRLAHRTTLYTPDLNKNPNPTVCFWHSKYHLQWGTYVGQIGSTVCVAAGGMFYRVSIYHVAWAKCSFLKPPSPWDTFCDAAPKFRVKTIASCRGKWWSFAFTPWLVQDPTDDLDPVRDSFKQIFIICYLGAPSRLPAHARTHIDVVKTENECTLSTMLVGERNPVGTGLIKVNTLQRVFQLSIHGKRFWGREFLFDFPEENYSAGVIGIYWVAEDRSEAAVWVPSRVKTQAVSLVSKEYEKISPTNLLCSEVPALPKYAAMIVKNRNEHLLGPSLFPPPPPAPVGTSSSRQVIKTNDKTGDRGAAAARKDPRTNSSVSAVGIFPGPSQEDLSRENVHFSRSELQKQNDLMNLVSCAAEFLGAALVEGTTPDKKSSWGHCRGSVSRITIYSRGILLSCPGICRDVFLPREDILGWTSKRGGWHGDTDTATPHACIYRGCRLPAGLQPLTTLAKDRGVFSGVDALNYYANVLMCQSQFSDNIVLNIKPPYNLVNGAAVCSVRPRRKEQLSFSVLAQLSLPLEGIIEKQQWMGKEFVGKIPNIHGFLTWMLVGASVCHWDITPGIYEYDTWLKMGFEYDDVCIAMLDTMCQGGPPDEVPPHCPVEFIGKTWASEFKHWKHSIADQIGWNIIINKGCPVQTFHDYHGIGGVNGFSIDKHPMVAKVRFAFRMTDGKIIVPNHIYEVYRFLDWRSSRGCTFGIGTSDLHVMGFALNPIREGTVRFDTIPLGILGPGGKEEKAVAVVSKMILRDVSVVHKERIPKVHMSQLEILLPFPTGIQVMLFLTKTDSKKYSLLSDPYSIRDFPIYVIPPDKQVAAYLVAKSGYTIPRSMTDVTIMIREMGQKIRLSRTCASLTKTPIEEEPPGLPDPSDLDVEVLFPRTSFRASRLKNVHVVPISPPGHWPLFLVVRGVSVKIAYAAHGLFDISMTTSGSETDSPEEAIESARSLLDIPCATISESRYRRAEKEEKTNVSEVIQLAKCLVENDKFYAKKSTVSRNSFTWMAEVAEHFMRQHCRGILIKLSQKEGLDRDETISVFCRFIDAYVTIFSSSYFCDGQELPTVNTKKFGTNLVDFTRPLPKRKVGKIKMSPTEDFLARMIFWRDVHNGVAREHDAVVDGPARVLSNGFRAPRAGTESGRGVVGFQRTNTVIHEVGVPVNHQSDLHGPLRRPDAEAFGAGDVSRCFPSLENTEELGLWMVISVGSSHLDLLPIRAYLGVRCWPGIWQQLSYPKWSNLLCSMGASGDFFGELIKRCRIDASAGVPIASQIFNNKYFSEKGGG